AGSRAPGCAARAQDRVSGCRGRCSSRISNRKADARESAPERHDEVFGANTILGVRSVVRERPAGVLLRGGDVAKHVPTLRAFRCKGFQSTGSAVSYLTSRNTTLLLTLETPGVRKTFSCRKRS